MYLEAAEPVSGPSAGLLVTEPVRGLADVAALFAAAPWLARAPRGDGHAVLVWPGLLASDRSTALLRRFLRHLGYDVSGWKLGRNRGPTEEVLSALPRAVASAAHRTGGPVSLVGWSLGGIYAREMARQYPHLVRQVITLGSPSAGDIGANHARRLYETLTGEKVAEQSELQAAIAGDLPVPVTSIYSRSDGIVNWRTCLLRPSATAENAKVMYAASTSPVLGPLVSW